VNRFKIALAIRFVGIAFFITYLAVVQIHAQAVDTNNCKFCGIWQYDDSGTKSYLKITREGLTKFKFVTGYDKNGQIKWIEIVVSNAAGVYLKPVNGKLVGRFRSFNFHAGKEITYKVTIQYKTKDEILYSIWSSIPDKTDRYEATKIRQ